MTANSTTRKILLTQSGTRTGSRHPSPRILRSGCSSLYPVLNCQNDRFWGELVNINFSEVDKAMQVTDALAFISSTECEPPAVPGPELPIPSSTECPMPGNLDTAPYFLNQLEDLKSLFHRTADQLKSVAEELLEGNPPGPLVNVVVESAQLKFTSLSAKVLDRKEELGIPMSLRTFGSLDQLASEVAAITEIEAGLAASREATHLAIRVLEDVQQLAYRGRPDFEPLHALKQSARALRGSHRSSARPKTYLPGFNPSRSFSRWSTSHLRTARTRMRLKKNRSPRLFRDFSLP